MKTNSVLVLLCGLLLFFTACGQQAEEESGAQAATEETTKAERVVIGDPSSGKPFSQAIKFGNILYVSGTLPIDSETDAEVRDSIEAETEQVLKNIERLVKMAGFELTDVVKATVYLKDLNDYAAMNSVYVKFFPENPPARACLGVSDILFGYRLEISCIAQK